MNAKTVQPKTACYHCGLPCEQDTAYQDDKPFCCAGCRAVYLLLSGANLGQYYRSDQAPGLRPAADLTGRHAYLDDPQVQSQLLDYAGEQRSRISLHIPQIHCASCIWLLENLYRLHPGISRSDATLPDRRVTIVFDREKTSLRQIVELLTRLGYEPEIRLASLGRKPTRRLNWRLYAKIGVAGFSFANIMLFSFPEYLSSGTVGETALSTTFRITSLILSLPVLFYSAADYFRSAWAGLKQRVINLDVPLALGIGMLFLRSAYDILSGDGPGYLDSFSGLVFLLLLGRLFQQKTFERLSFDRDYRAYFPISCVRLEDHGETTVPITQLRPGNRILIRNQELVPADAVLIRGHALIDYSFVTGESQPRELVSGDRLHAGGRQTGEAIELEVIREVSDSYLISLWQDDRLAPSNRPSISSMANRIGKYFIGAVLAAAVASGLYWGLKDPSRVSHVVTSVLIVACPCALALASPFVLGTAARLWGERKFFVRAPQVIETLSQIDTIVFDKTGTLTLADRQTVSFEGTPLTPDQEQLILSLVRHSTHPSSRLLAQALPSRPSLEVSGFVEIPGKGLAGTVDGRELRIGSLAWAGAGARLVETFQSPDQATGAIFVAIEKRLLGFYQFRNVYREGLSEGLTALRREYRISVLSGDGPGERDRLTALLGESAELHFSQSPHDKLDHLDALGRAGRRTLMIGDGLNDSGALRAAMVGLAVTEDASSFAPACDGIIEAPALAGLPGFLAFSRHCRTVIMMAFGLSLAYNAIGLAFAVSGRLSPLVSAILMPISSVSVVVFATLVTRLVARFQRLP